MSNDNFDVKILAEKLSKLNNSQQSIESLSRWCVSNRKKARQIVETWDKSLSSAEKDQCVSLLFLANDILQNSRRKGSEFVNEFWKVLPAALKRIYSHGDENGRKTVSRLVDIWEERKVFGSRAQNLKEDMFGKEAVKDVGKEAGKEAGKDAPSQMMSNGKSLNPIKIVKKDAQAIRIKLPVGDVLEKIVMAFHNLHDQCSNEEATLAKCHLAVLSSERLEKDVETATTQGIQPGIAMVNKLQDYESILIQCVEQLEGAEATRAALVSQLKEALQDQGKKLDIVQSQLQIARSRISGSGNLRQKLSSVNSMGPFTTTMDASAELEKPLEHSKPFAPVQATNELHPHASQPVSSLQLPAQLQRPTTSLQLPAQQLQRPTTSFAPRGASNEENKKATAAAVAAKLAASTSSSQMFASVLSSLVAEEAAKAGFNAGVPEKRQKLEAPSTDSSNSAMGANPFYSTLQQSLSSMPFVPTSIQLVSQGNQIQSSLPPPPPPPLPQTNQFMQSGGMMLPALPFGFMGGSLPPPPIPSSMPMVMGRPSNQQSQPTLPQLQQPQPPVTSGGGYYMPPSMGMYGLNQQATTPSPVRRQ